MRPMILDIAGSPSDRGKAQGVAFSDAIAQHIVALHAMWHAAGIASPQSYARDLLADTTFDEAIARHTPELMEEVAGIARGAGVEADDALILQLMDEEWAYRARSLPAPPGDKCSSLAIRDVACGVTYVGQNMDLGVYADGLQQLIRHRPEGKAPAQIVFTLAGMLGLMGANAAGVGVCVNAMPQLPARSSGLPVAFVIRRLLAASSADEAGELVRALPHATSQHYLVADRDAVISLEATPLGVCQCRSPWLDRAFHTNHPLSAALAEDYPTPVLANTVARLRALELRLSQASPTRDAVAAALSSRDDPDHPLCRPRREGQDPISGVTVGSLISEIRRDGSVRGVVSMGPPSERGYTSWNLV